MLMWMSPALVTSDRERGQASISDSCGKSGCFKHYVAQLQAPQENRTSLRCARLMDSAELGWPFLEKGATLAG